MKELAQEHMALDEVRFDGKKKKRPSTGPNAAESL